LFELPKSKVSENITEIVKCQPIAAKIAENHMHSKHILIF